MEGRGEGVKPHILENHKKKLFLLTFNQLVNTFDLTKWLITQKCIEF